MTIPSEFAQFSAKSSSLGTVGPLIRLPPLGTANLSCGQDVHQFLPNRTHQRQEVELQQQRARDAETQALTQVPGVASDDLTNDLCLAESCDSDRYVPWLYRDATHLSIDGALKLTDRFQRLIVDHVR